MKMKVIKNGVSEFREITEFWKDKTGRLIPQVPVSESEIVLETSNGPIIIENRTIKENSINSKCRQRLIDLKLDHLETCEICGSMMTPNLLCPYRQ